MEGGPPTTLHWVLTLSQVCEQSRKKTQLLHLHIPILGLINFPNLCLIGLLHRLDPRAALTLIPAPAPLPVVFCFGVTLHV